MFYIYIHYINTYNNIISRTSVAVSFVFFKILLNFKARPTKTRPEVKPK